MNATQRNDREHSQLFLVRLWTEESNDGARGQIEWCGKLQNVVSGQAQYFRGWQTLIDLLLEMSATDANDVGASEGSSKEVSR